MRSQTQAGLAVLCCALLLAAAAPAAALRVAIVPGMAVVSAQGMLWYSDLQQRLQSSFPGLEVALRTMPAPIRAPESLWLPFMEHELAVGADTIVVGHSSGAVAAMRYAETHHVVGLVLVAAYASDLGSPLEQASGYFDAPWDWAAIKRNSGFIIQIGSEDDPLVPFEAQQRAAELMGASFYRFADKGHFLQSTAPEIAEITIREITDLEAAGGGRRRKDEAAAGGRRSAAPAESG